MLTSSSGNIIHVTGPLWWESTGYRWIPLIKASDAELWCFLWSTPEPLQWRHNEHDSVSNHQPHDCLLNRLFRCRSKKTPKLCVTGLCVWNSPGTGEFPAQMASYAENISIWWRHHAKGWANNRDASDLKRHRAHYDATVISYIHCIFALFCIALSLN